MPKGYWVVHIEVHDADNYKPYMAAGGEAVRKWGGRFLVRGGRSEQMEGASRPRHVVVEFDSYEHAIAAYNSTDFQAAVALRQPYSMADVTVVEGPPDA